MSAPPEKNPFSTPETIASWIRQNETYREGFSRLMLLVQFEALVMVLLALGLFFHIYTDRVEDRYFAELIDGRKQQMAGLDFPNMGMTAMSEWATNTAIGIMTFGFNDHEQRFEAALKKFTPKGWETFREGMILSGLVQGVVEARQIVTSVPNGLAILTREGIIEGVYTFVFEVPILITFRSGDVKLSMRKTVEMNVQKVPTRQNPEAIAISLWNIR